MATEMLSEHFTLAEFTYSQTASRAGIPNTPTEEAHEHLRALAEVMEAVRALCGDNPVTITSGYRNAQVNALVGGSTNSAHISGLACDFIVPAWGTPLDICRLLEPELADLRIDQLIREFDSPEGSGWVHLAICGPGDTPDCQCLTITNSGTTEGFA
jgi:zinc D-Ala-D-Ala carboxypeptidase